MIQIFNKKTATIKTDELPNIMNGGLEDCLHKMTPFVKVEISGIYRESKCIKCGGTIFGHELGELPEPSRRLNKLLGLKNRHQFETPFTQYKAIE